MNDSQIAFLIKQIHRDVTIAEDCARASRRDEKTFGLNTRFGREANRNANYWEGRKTGSEVILRRIVAAMEGAAEEVVA